MPDDGVNWTIVKGKNLLAVLLCRECVFMSLEEIKREISTLNFNEKQEVALFLDQLRLEEERDAKLGEFLRGRLAEAERGDFSNKTLTEIWSKYRSMAVG